MRIALSVVLVVLTGCAPKRIPRLPDAPRPPDVVGTLYIAVLGANASASRSVFTQPRERDLMTRVLLSPNLVFEASRSSAGEPRTVGPKGGRDTTPNQEDALGEPVDIVLSTRLIEHLSSRGAVLLAPAITRRFSDLWWCSDPAKCPQATWVERLMMLYGLKRWNIDPKDREKDAPQPPALEVRPQDLATAALAVRALDFGFRASDAVVERTGDGQFTLRLRRGAGDAVGLCRELKVQIPLVYFQAELVSLKDGRILARINEQRGPSVNADSARFTVTGYRAETAYSFTEIDGDGSGVDSTKYAYTKEWNATVGSPCDVAKARLEEWQVAAYASLRSDLNAITAELFKTAFDPLFQPGRDTVSTTAIEPPPAPSPAPTVAGCSTNTDCRGGRVCQSGRCVVP